ncbi:MAG: zinc-dependent metalloprotease [Acidimicrobiales bacterium]
MASDSPLDPIGGEGDPFSQLGPFGDMFRMMAQQQGASSWDVARQLAASIATDGGAEGNVDPVARMQFEQLARVAELRVASVTGLPVGLGGGGISIVAVNRGQWVERSTGAYRELLEALAGALNQAPPVDPEIAMDDDPFARMLAPMLQAMRPAMLGMTAGSMLGHLARRSFGMYDLPLPRPQDDELLVVVPNLDAFGEEWSLPSDDLRLWVCVHEVAHHAVLAVPHVRAQLSALLRDYAGGFSPDGDALGSLFEGFELDPGDASSMAALQERFADPEILLGAMITDAQRHLLPRLEALVAVIVGYVDHVMDEVGEGLIGSYSMVTEALRRRRVTADPSDRFVEKLFGLELTQAAYDRGSAFVDGIVERAGAQGLARLWESDETLPTPNEVDAPGLWLARIELPTP